MVVVVPARSHGWGRAQFGLPVGRRLHAVYHDSETVTANSAAASWRPRWIHTFWWLHLWHAAMRASA